jgi:Ca2+-transporting ATPase
LFDFKSNQVFDDKSFNKSELSQLIQFAMWSSEPVPFDPMEKTLHKVYEETQTSDQKRFSNDTRISVGGQTTDDDPYF